VARDQFQKERKAFLAAYKRNVLGVTENGIWRKHQREYAHILPVAQRQLNILSTIREAFWDWFRVQDITLHSYFHHLNSSQALCFNMFFPLLADNARPFKKILDALRICGEPALGATFEFEPDRTEGTCFDFMLPMASGARIYFELKYTESEFGKASADSDHIDKFQRVYERRLSGRFKESFCCQDRFLANYQILRNIWHLDRESGDIAVFLFPAANRLLRQDEAIIQNCVTEDFKSRVRICYFENILASLQRDNRCTDREIASLREFEAKYFPYAHVPTMDIENVAASGISRAFVQQGASQEL
jgi:hypothetical protein